MIDNATKRSWYIADGVLMYHRRAVAKMIWPNDPQSSTDWRIAEEHMELIVRAVNAHDALVAALDDALATLVCVQYGTAVRGGASIFQAITVAREALKSVKGET